MEPFTFPYVPQRWNNTFACSIDEQVLIDQWRADSSTWAFSIIWKEASLLGHGDKVAPQSKVLRFVFHLNSIYVSEFIRTSKINRTKFEYLNYEKRNHGKKLHSDRIHSSDSFPENKDVSSPRL